MRSEVTLNLRSRRFYFQKIFLFGQVKLEKFPHRTKYYRDTKKGGENLVEEMKRRFSLEDDFMNYSTDDLIYGYLSYCSTFDPVNKERYIAIKNVSPLKKYMAAMINKTTKTVSNRIEKLVEKELLIKKVKGNQEVFVFTEKSKTYQLVNYDILFYLLVSRNQFAIKVYVYLLNKYLWKLQTHEYYIFTLEELAQALGYAESSICGVTPMLNIVLESFYREGLLKWREVVESKVIDNKVVPVVRKELLFIAENQNQLPALTIERVNRETALKFNVA